MKILREKLETRRKEVYFRFVQLNFLKLKLRFFEIFFKNSHQLFVVKLNLKEKRFFNYPSAG